MNGFRGWQAGRPYPGSGYKHSKNYGHHDPIAALDCLTFVFVAFVVFEIQADVLPAAEAREKQKNLDPSGQTPLV